MILGLEHFDLLKLDWNKRKDIVLMHHQCNMFFFICRINLTTSLSIMKLNLKFKAAQSI